MRTGRLIGVGLTAIILVSCYNVVPVWSVSIRPATTQNGFLKIDDVVDDVAKELEFVPSTPTFQYAMDSDGKFERIRQWTWSKREWTIIALHRYIDSNNYKIVFADIHTDGSELIGEPCRKYLKFVSALKKHFGSEQHRLKFYRETCKSGSVSE